MSFIRKRIYYFFHRIHTHTQNIVVTWLEKWQHEWNEVRMPQKMKTEYENQLLQDFKRVCIRLKMRIIRADLYYYSYNCDTLIRAKENGKRKHMFASI